MNTKLDGIILSKVKTRLFEPLDNFFSLRAQLIMLETCAATYNQSSSNYTKSSSRFCLLVLGVALYVKAQI